MNELQRLKLSNRAFAGWNEVYRKRILEMEVLLRSVTFVKHRQDKPSLANQGQCLDGFSALHNYNHIAERIDAYFST